MARRTLTTDRLIAGLGVAVLLLGGLAFWVATHGWRPAPEPPPSERVLRQLREQRGPDWEVRYIEAGRDPVTCGYVGRRDGGRAIGFISRPNRLLLADDPLKSEFAAMMKTACPSFARHQPPPAS